ncbi:MAG: methyltransferase domain-containing protein [Lachnospiraceae bacterium]|nr:methyltransferase domain-containing protein [Lachnospiraceae bacterium]
MNYIEEIQDWIRKDNVDSAMDILKQWKQSEDYIFDDTAAILEGSIYLMKQNDTEALDCIYRGISANPYNHELYFMLGQLKEQEGNYHQAQFSYENALYFCNEEDYKILADYYEQFRVRNTDKNLANVSIILVTYNQLDMTRLCVDSIRSNVPNGTYEIIVVDNASTDGTAEWLSEQSDIRSILNSTNRGFPAACNQGAELAQNGNDIFLLNNDTIIMKNSIYTLRMALYEEEMTGAVSASSNNAGKRQEIDEKFEDIEEYIRYAKENNGYHPDRHEKRLTLMGFALLTRYGIWRKVGGLDEIYGRGNFEDDDYCMKLLLSSYTLILCRDSFIYHFGHQSFQGMKKDQPAEYSLLFHNNRDKFDQKWDIRWGYFSHVRTDILEYLEEDRNQKFSLLEIGCAAGATLLEIGNRYPKAEFFGMELDDRSAYIASHYLNVVQGNVEEKRNPFQRKYDYIVLGDVLEHLHDAKDILLTLKTWLKDDGHFLISLPNVMHISVINALLHGRFEYKDEGILDRTHLRFFTKTEIVLLMQECGLTIERFKGVSIRINPKNRLFMKQLCSMDATISETELGIYQYVMRVSG